MVTSWHWLSHTVVTLRTTVRSTDSPLLNIATMPALNDSTWRPWLQRNQIRVSAIVFFGRREYVRILDKYVKRNLKSAGGILEEVLWIVRTENTQDLKWLDSVLLPSEPEHYKKVRIIGDGFDSHYKSLAPDMYYIKLDDDIVFIREGAVDAMLQEKLRGRFWIVSANVINHSVLTWVHAALGVVRTDPQSLAPKNSSNDFEEELNGLLEQLPFTDMKYGPFERCSLTSMECAAICHYTFLDILAHDKLSRYDFNLWDFHAFGYSRWSINTILFKGNDLYREDILKDDELSIAALLPESKGKHCGAIGSAIVVHLAYGPQRAAGLEQQTRVMELYEKLAQNLTGALLPI